ncbi:Versatile peroxidase [Paramyrothecium foliicola]|nr:Versatile peroxidase [Paramyrothecium foliicola]
MTAPGLESLPWGTGVFEKLTMSDTNMVWYTEADNFALGPEVHGGARRGEQAVARGRTRRTNLKARIILGSLTKMRFSSILATTIAATGIQEAYCYPGIGKTLGEIELHARQAEDHEHHGSLSKELIGDLATLPDTKLTKTGRAIKALLTLEEDAESNETTLIRLPLIPTTLCKLDTCCVWQHITSDMEAVFRGTSGRCTELARQAVRIGFHDAGTWSKSAGGGGADGSIILAGEMARSENRGMEEIVAKYKEFYTKYTRLGYSITYADMIQVGANVATVVCPLGPRIKTYVGRKDKSIANPDDKLPSPFAEADSLIALFKDKTISPRALIALLGAHTTSQQRFVNQSRSGDPQDSTPGVWDMLYYQETFGRVQTPERVFMFPSDLNLAAHPETKPVFEEFAEPGDHAQEDWNEILQDYASSYVRLSLLGVNNINSLTDCTKMLPRATTSFVNKDQSKLDKWLQSINWSPISKKIAELLASGNEITTPLESIPTDDPSI